jgi:heme oxygenase
MLAGMRQRGTGGLCPRCEVGDSHARRLNAWSQGPEPVVAPSKRVRAANRSSVRRPDPVDGTVSTISKLRVTQPHPLPRSCGRGSSASRWLRSETREQHVAVEAELAFVGLRDRAALAGLLRGWDAVWGAVWCAVSSPGACTQAGEELLVAAVQARRWIRFDLASLGGAVAADLDAGQRARDRTRLDGLLAVPADSWGVAYVLRGSRLGGAVQAVRVSAALGLPPDCGTRFLVSAGTDPGREWVAFRRRLDGLDLSPAELAGAVEAAKWTFGWVGAMTVAGVRAARALPA